MRACNCTHTHIHTHTHTQTHTHTHTQLRLLPTKYGLIFSVGRSMPKDFGINFEILPKIDFHSYCKIKLNWVCSNKRCVRKLSIFSEKHPGLLNEIFLMRIMFSFWEEDIDYIIKKYIGRVGCE